VGQIAILTRIRGVKFVSYVKPSGIDVCIAIVQASEEVHGEIAKVAGVRRLTIDEANELLRRYGLLIDARWLLRQVESRNAQRRPRPTANAVIYTNDFSNVAATFTTEFLSNITQEQLATEFREYWLNVAGLAKGGSANLGVDSLGSIRDYSNLTMDAFLGQLADPVQGQPGWHIGYADVTATYDTTYGLATSSAIYVFFLNFYDVGEDRLEIRALDAAGNLYSNIVAASPIERWGSKWTLYFFVDVANAFAEARYPYGEATELYVSLVDIPAAVFDSITDMRVYFGARMYVYTGYTGNCDNYYDEVSVSTVVVYTQTLTETLALSDIVGKTSIRQVADAIALTDATLKSPSITKSEPVSLYDPTTAKTTSIIKAETLTLTDLIAKSITKILSETATLTDYVTALKVLVLMLSEVLSLYDPTIAKSTSAVKSETITLTDVYSRIATYTRQFAETTKLTDVIAKTPSRILAETVSLADVLIIPLKVLLTERLTLTDKLEVWKRVIPIVRALLGITPMAWTGATLAIRFKPILGVQAPWIIIKQGEKITLRYRGSRGQS